MARPPKPAEQRRDRYVALRLTGAEEAPVRAVADTEHSGDLSAAIRTLLVEALAARTIRALQPDSRPGAPQSEAEDFHGEPCSCAPLRCYEDECAFCRASPDDYSCLGGL